MKNVLYYTYYIENIQFLNSNLYFPITYLPIPWTAYQGILGI